MRKQGKRTWMLLLCALLLTMLFSASAFAADKISVTGQTQSGNNITFTVTAPSGMLYAACYDMDGRMQGVYAGKWSGTAYTVSVPERTGKLSFFSFDGSNKPLAAAVHDLVVADADKNIRGGSYDNVIITSSVGDGNVTLDGVTVRDKLVVQGGGSKSVHLSDCTVLGNITVDKAEGEAPRLDLQNTSVPAISAESPVIIEADKDSEVTAVEAKSDVTVQGDDTKVGNVTAAAENVKLTVADTANVQKVTAEKPVTIEATSEKATIAAVEAKSNVTVQGAKVNTVTVPEDVAVKPEIKVETGAAVSTVTANSQVIITVTVQVTVTVTGTAPVEVAVETTQEVNISATGAATVEVSTTQTTAVDVKLNNAAVEHIHKWDAGNVTKPATCAEEGTVTYTCSGEGTCSLGDTKTETLRKLPHTEVVDNAVAATCEADGKTAGKHCSECETVLVEQKTIPALGHVYGAAAYVWNGSSCTATRTCVIDTKHTVSETKAGEYVKDTDATCTTNEKGHYAVTFNDTQFGSAATAANSVEVANTASGHKYGEVSYEWKAVGGAYICTATHVCEHNANHKETETVKASYAVTKEPTGTTEGEGTYTAVFVNSDFGTKTWTVTLPATNTVVTTWDEFNMAINDSAVTGITVAGNITVPGAYAPTSRSITVPVTVKSGYALTVAGYDGDGTVTGRDFNDLRIVGGGSLTLEEGAALATTETSKDGWRCAGRIYVEPMAVRLDVSEGTVADNTCIYYEYNTKNKMPSSDNLVVNEENIPDNITFAVYVEDELRSAMEDPKCTGGIMLEGDLTLENDLTVTKDLATDITIFHPLGMELTVPEGKTLTVAKDAVLYNYGTLNNNGTVNVYGTLENANTVNNRRFIDVLGGTLINSGTITGIKDKPEDRVYASNIGIEGGATLTNTGTINDSLAVADYYFTDPEQNKPCTVRGVEGVAPENYDYMAVAFGAGQIQSCLSSDKGYEFIVPCGTDDENSIELGGITVPAGKTLLLKASVFDGKNTYRNSFTVSGGSLTMEKDGYVVCVGSTVSVATGAKIHAKDRNQLERLNADAYIYADADGYTLTANLETVTTYEQFAAALEDNEAAGVYVDADITVPAQDHWTELRVSKPVLVAGGKTLTVAAYTTEGDKSGFLANDLTIVEYGSLTLGKNAVLKTTAVKSGENEWFYSYTGRVCVCGGTLDVSRGTVADGSFFNFGYVGDALNSNALILGENEPEIEFSVHNDAQLRAAIADGKCTGGVIVENDIALANDLTVTKLVLVNDQWMMTVPAGKTLSVPANQELQISGALLVNGGTLSNAGTVYSYGVIDIIGGTLNNAGTGTFEGLFIPSDDGGKECLSLLALEHSSFSNANSDEAMHTYMDFVDYYRNDKVLRTTIAEGTTVNFASDLRTKVAAAFGDTQTVKAMEDSSYEAFIPCGTATSGVNTVELGDLAVPSGTALVLKESVFDGTNTYLNKFVLSAGKTLTLQRKAGIDCKGGELELLGELDRQGENWFRVSDDVTLGGKVVHNPDELKAALAKGGDIYLLPFAEEDQTKIVFAESGEVSHETQYHLNTAVTIGNTKLIALGSPIAVFFDGGFTVAADKTLTFNGLNVVAGAGSTVNGTVKIGGNAQLVVQGKNETTLTNNGTIVVGGEDMSFWGAALAIYQEGNKIVNKGLIDCYGDLSLDMGDAAQFENVESGRVNFRNLAEVKSREDFLAAMESGVVRNVVFTQDVTLLSGDTFKGRGTQYEIPKGVTVTLKQGNNDEVVTLKQGLTLKVYGQLVANCTVYAYAGIDTPENEPREKYLVNDYNIHFMKNFAGFGEYVRNAVEDKLDPVTENDIPLAVGKTPQDYDEWPGDGWNKENMTFLAVYGGVKPLTDENNTNRKFWPSWEPITYGDAKTILGNVYKAICGEVMPDDKVCINARDPEHMDDGRCNALLTAFLAALPKETDGTTESFTLIRDNVNEGNANLSNDGRIISGKRFTNAVTITCDTQYLNGDGWGGELRFVGCDFTQGVTVVMSDNVNYRVDFSNTCTGAVTVELPQGKTMQDCRENRTNLEFFGVNGMNIDTTTNEAFADINDWGHDKTVSFTLNGLTITDEGEGAFGVNARYDENGKDEQNQPIFIPTVEVQGFAKDNTIKLGGSFAGKLRVRGNVDVSGVTLADNNSWIELSGGAGSAITLGGNSITVCDDCGGEYSFTTSGGSINVVNHNGFADITVNNIHVGSPHIFGSEADGVFLALSSMNGISVSENNTPEISLQKWSWNEAEKMNQWMEIPFVAKFYDENNDGAADKLHLERKNEDNWIEDPNNTRLSITFTDGTKLCYDPLWWKDIFGDEFAQVLKDEFGVELEPASFDEYAGEDGFLRYGDALAMLDAVWKSKGKGDTLSADVSLSWKENDHSMNWGDVNELLNRFELLLSADTVVHSASELANALANGGTICLCELPDEAKTKNKLNEMESQYHLSDLYGISTNTRLVGMSEKIAVFFDGGFTVAADTTLTADRLNIVAAADSSIYGTAVACNDGQLIVQGEGGTELTVENGGKIIIGDPDNDRNAWLGIYQTGNKIDNKGTIQCYGDIAFNVNDQNRFTGNMPIFGETVSVNSEKELTDALAKSKVGEITIAKSFSVSGKKEHPEDEGFLRIERGRYDRRILIAKGSTLTVSAGSRLEIGEGVKLEIAEGGKLDLLGGLNVFGELKPDQWDKETDDGHRIYVVEHEGSYINFYPDVMEFGKRLLERVSDYVENETLSLEVSDKVINAGKEWPNLEEEDDERRDGFLLLVNYGLAPHEEEDDQGKDYIVWRPFNKITYGEALTVLTNVYKAIWAKAGEAMTALPETVKLNDMQADWCICGGDLDELLDKFMAVLPKQTTEINEFILERRDCSQDEESDCDGGWHELVNGAHNNTVRNLHFTKPVTVSCATKDFEEGDNWGGEIRFVNCQFDAGVTVTARDGVNFRVDFTNSCSGADGAAVQVSVDAPQATEDAPDGYTYDENGEYHNNVELCGVGGMAITANTYVHIKNVKDQKFDLTFNGSTVTFDGTGKNNWFEVDARWDRWYEGEEEERVLKSDPCVQINADEPGENTVAVTLTSKENSPFAGKLRVSGNVDVSGVTLANNGRIELANDRYCSDTTLGGNNITVCDDCGGAYSFTGTGTVFVPNGNQNAKITVNSVYLDTPHIFGECGDGIFFPLQNATVDENGVLSVGEKILSITVEQGEWLGDHAGNWKELKCKVDTTQPGKIHLVGVEGEDWISDPGNVRVTVKVTGGCTVVYDTMMWKPVQMDEFITELNTRLSKSYTLESLGISKTEGDLTIGDCKTAFTKVLSDSGKTDVAMNTIINDSNYRNELEKWTGEYQEAQNSGKQDWINDVKNRNPDNWTRRWNDLDMMLDALINALD